MLQFFSSPERFQCWPEPHRSVTCSWARPALGDRSDFKDNRLPVWCCVRDLPSWKVALAWASPQPALVYWRNCLRCLVLSQDIQSPFLCFHSCFHIRLAVYMPDLVDLDFYSRCRSLGNDSSIRLHSAFRLVARRSEQSVGNIQLPSQYHGHGGPHLNTFRKTGDLVQPHLSHRIR